MGINDDTDSITLSKAIGNGEYFQIVSTSTLLERVDKAIEKCKSKEDS